MSKHTPGPWGYTAAPFGHIYAITQAANDVIRVETNNDANARLMATAPELLEALTHEYARLAYIHNEWPGRNTADGQARLCKLRDLIAKATGLSEREVQDRYSAESVS